jgi:hypothetical protein
MKRQKNNCFKCYSYEPHFHPERLHDSLPETRGDQFIWCCSSSDISFAEADWMNAILDRIKTRMDRIFFFQSKSPKVFKEYDFPANVLLGITLETNSDVEYQQISKAPLPSARILQFANLECVNKKVITIEPILPFYLDLFLAQIELIKPELIYIGYDSKKTHLNEPRLHATMELVRGLERFTKVKQKLMREPWNYREANLENFF